MPTTTRSSDLALAPAARRGGRLAAAVGALGLAAACASHSQPVELFVLTPAAPQYRAAQTRWFETRDERELLSASAAVLQDLGFHVEESVRELGFLRASKERSAREDGQYIARVIVAIVSFGYLVLPVDLHQKIAVALVARPLDAEGTRHEVRVSFYRVVWKSDGIAYREEVLPGEQRMEMLRDPFLYQQFFARLSKAVFLEAFTL